MIEKLSKTELHVMKLLAQGFSQKSVASMLFNSPNTISTHVKRSKLKLNAHSSVHAILIVHRYVLLDEFRQESKR